MKRSSTGFRHRPEQPDLRMGLSGKDALRCPPHPDRGPWLPTDSIRRGVM